MPVKRRVDLRRRQLDDGTMEDQFYGPGTCLFNGHGYLAPYGDGFFRDKPDDVKAAVLAEMRDDWFRQSSTIMAAWNARTEHQVGLASDHHGAPPLPWSAIQFGEPSCR